MYIFYYLEITVYAEEWNWIKHVNNKINEKFTFIFSMEKAHP